MEQILGVKCWALLSEFFNDSSVKTFP